MTYAQTDNEIASPLSYEDLGRQWIEGLTGEIDQFLDSSEDDLGHLEESFQQHSAAVLCRVLEQAAQKKADATPLNCPVCGCALSRCSSGHQRTFTTRYGKITIQRTRGYCKRCRKWRTPADEKLGLGDTAGYSPAVQEMSALLATKMPVAEASLVLQRLTGLQLPRSSLDREARRQGQRAREQREQDDQPEAAAREAVQLELGLEPYQLIIQIDAWNIRERDDWGQSAKLRKKGQEPERWHWVYSGTVFRLDHRGRSAGGRAQISQRGYVATRAGIDGLRQQLHAEALRRGLGQAAGALVIADGAVWIWRLAEERWPQARQRLDYYHAVQHLAAVGRAIHGTDRAALAAWLKPLVRQLKNQSALKVIHRLEDLLAEHEGQPAHETIARELKYFGEHQERMDYRRGGRAGEPIGSGAIESTCRQFQCRFKRPGQYWSREGDEALLCLDTYWRNGRWHRLFPHAAPPNPARN